MKIIKNTDSVDIDQKCLGLDASRDTFPRDVRDHIHKNRGLHIQIRHNGDAQTFAQAVSFANLIAAAPDMLNALENVEEILNELQSEYARTLILKAIKKARGET